MNADIKSPLLLKFLIALMLVGGMVGDIAMWSRALPLPDLSR
jgi:hypothetical protein